MAKMSLLGSLRGELLFTICVQIPCTRPCITSEIHHISSAFTGKNIWSRPYTKKVPIVFLNAFSCKNPFIKLCWSKATQRKVDPEKIKNDSILKIVGWPSLPFSFKIPLQALIICIPFHHFQRLFFDLMGLSYYYISKDISSFNLLFFII